MPSTRAVAREPRKRVRAVRRITWEVVLPVGRLRAFFTTECDNNAAEMLEQPVDRKAAATGLSRSTVIRIANGEYADTRPLSGDEMEIELEDAEADGVNGCSSSEEDGEDEGEEDKEDAE